MYILHSVRLKRVAFIRWFRCFFDTNCLVWGSNKSGKRCIRMVRNVTTSPFVHTYLYRILSIVLFGMLFTQYVHTSIAHNFFHPIHYICCFQAERLFKLFSVDIRHIHWNCFEYNRFTDFINCRSRCCVSISNWFIHFSGMWKLFCFKTLTKKIWFFLFWKTDNSSIFFNWRVWINNNWCELKSIKEININRKIQINNKQEWIKNWF